MGKKIKIIGEYFRPFWDWWIGEMIGLVPERVKRVFFPQEKVACLHLAQGRLLLRFTDEKEAEVEISRAGSGDLGRDLREVFSEAEGKGFSTGSIEVELSPDMLLSRLIRLPETAKNNFRQIISLQFDRYFPLSEEKVIFDCAIRQGTEKSEVMIDVALVRRELVAELLQILDSLNVTLKKIYAFEEREASKAKDKTSFTFMDRSGFLRPEEHKPVFALAICLLVLVPLCLGIYYYKLSARETWLREQASVLSREVKEIEKISTRIASEQQQRRLYQQKIGEVRLSEILTILTKAVPDDSWITELNKSGDRLTISGKAPNASTLAAGLDREGFFEKVSSSSTVIQPGGQSERFSLSLELKPGDQEDDQQLQARTVTGGGPQ